MLESLRRFVALYRFPSSPRPCLFLGWPLNGEGPLPPPEATTTTVRRQGLPVGHRTRGTWTTTLDYVQKTLQLGSMLLATEDGRYEYARDKRPGLLVVHSASCHATLQRSQPKPQQPDLFALRYASMLQNLPASCSAFTSTALRAGSASLGTACPVLGASGRPGIMPQSMHTGTKTLGIQ